MSKLIITYDPCQKFIDFINTALDTDFKLDDDTRTVTHLKENDDGTYTILAVVVLNRWYKHHCEASIASSSKGWATRKYLNAVYSYVFEAAGRARMNFLVETHNAAAITLHYKLGHTFEGLCRDMYGEGKDGLLFGYTRTDYNKSKWIKRK